MPPRRRLRHREPMVVVRATQRLARHVPDQAATPLLLLVAPVLVAEVMIRTAFRMPVIAPRRAGDEVHGA